MPDLPDPEPLRALAVGVANEAGALVARRRHAAAGEVLGTKSSLTDLVTQVDHDAEALIVERLTAARPGDGILGEEGGERPGRSGVRWVVDPLDGTVNYLYGYPAYAVSIAAEVAGAVVAGAVHDASGGETFSAALGGGAWCDGRPIRTSAAADLATSLVGTGFSYVAERRARQARVLARVLPAVRDVRRGGAAALDLCWVACGRLDAYYERGLQPWDLAAGDLIVREAGGRTGGIDGEPVRSGSLWAAAPGVADALVALLAAAGEGG